MTESVDYERGWQDAITHLSPPGKLEQAKLFSQIAGYHRTLTGVLDQLVRDHARIERALDLVPALEQAQVERDWLLAEATDEVRERFFAARRAEAAGAVSGGTPEPTDG